MSHLLDDDDLPPHRNERELTLSTGSILGIFFGLVLICALFFGFGYNMGRKSTPVVAGAAADSPYENAASANTAYNSAKPSAGSPVGSPSIPISPSDTSTGPGEVVGPAPHKSSAPPTNTAVPSLSLSRNTESSVSAQEPAPITRVERPMPPVSGSSGTGSFVVQVAAVSHQEDADLLVSALQRKGYSVAARNQPGDKLVHIQVGPFSDHKDADTMRLRLTSDGYNAIIKQL